MIRKRKLCIVAPYATTHLLPEFALQPGIGGSQVQIKYIANTIGDEWESHFVLEDRGQEALVAQDNLFFHKSYHVERGIRFLRYVHPRMTKIWQTMARIDADIYYQRAAGTTTALVAAFCKVHKKPFVYAVG